MSRVADFKCEPTSAIFTNGPIDPKELWDTFRHQLLVVEQLMSDAVATSGSLGNAKTYHLSGDGKRWRPLILLAVASQLDCDIAAAQRAAAAVELLHNASLVHDDLADHDAMRRGRETVWKRFGAETALNLGDLFIAGSYHVLAEIQPPDARVARLTSLFASSTREVIAGHALELDATWAVATTLADYLRIARGKSGVLMALPVVAALTLAGADAAVMARARLAMEWLGVAYQMQDDLHDLYGLKPGRQAGGDLREGRMSLPVVEFLSVADHSECEAFVSFASSNKMHRRSQVQRWVQRIRQPDVISRCDDALDNAVSSMSREMQTLPEGLKQLLAAVQKLIVKPMTDDI
jgi:geranylgeranyl pyrophosphate synthase